jgi:raffinose/stachyose/melibiose transport system substrate-binding protein
MNEKTQIDKKETVNLKLWHIWVTRTENQKAPFESILEDYSKENSNINFEVDTYVNETYKNKIKTAIAVNEAPDIFFTWGSGFAKPFVEAGSVLPLDGYIENETLDKIKSGSLDNFTYNGKLYGLPMYSWAGILYCNEELFDKYDIKLPETFDELLGSIEKFNKNGIVPIAAGEKERWPGVLLHNILTIRTVGIEKSQNAINGDENFNQEEFIEAVKLLEKLVDVGAFDKDVIKMTKDEAEASFINGEVAMYYMGNWSTASWDEEDSLVKGKIISINFPIIEGAEGDQDAFLGGAIDTFMISSNSDYKTESVEVIKYISEQLSKKSAYIGYGIPCWKDDVDKTKLSLTNAQIFDLVDEDAKFFLAWDTILEGEISNSYKNLVTKIFTRQITPEEFVKELDKLFE